MTNYNYNEAIKNDILEAINDYDIEGLDKDDAYEKLYEDMWIDDSVTGNGSGSYTFNTAKAKEYLEGNEDLAREALQEFCTPADEIAKRFLDGDYEYFDVTIRCYLLGQVLGEVIDEMF